MSDAIRALREAVEANANVVAVSDFVVVAFPHPKYYRVMASIMKAHTGSLDAALALMRAVLPGWHCDLSTHPGDGALVWLPHEEAKSRGASYMTRHRAEADTPARALLLAILKALEAQAEIRQSPVHLGNQEDSP